MSEPMYYFLDSASIQCYPTSRRGNGIDPESYILTERNVARFINSVTRGHNFIIGKSSGDSVMLECVIGGYFFKLNLTEVEGATQTWSRVYAVIKTGEITLSIGDNSSVKTDVLLYSGETSTDTILDDDNKFHGLLITDTISDGDTYLVLKDSTINVFNGVFGNQAMAICEDNVTNDSGTPISERLDTKELNVSNTDVSISVNNTGISLNADWVEDGENLSQEYSGMIRYYHNGLIHHLKTLVKEEDNDGTIETITLYRWLGFEQSITTEKTIEIAGQETTIYFDSSINAHILPQQSRLASYGTDNISLLTGNLTKMSVSEIKTVLNDIKGIGGCQYHGNYGLYLGVRADIMLSGESFEDTVSYMYDATAFGSIYKIVKLHKASQSNIDLTTGSYIIEFNNDDIITDNYIDYSTSSQLLTIK